MENDLRILRDRLVAVEDRAETDDALLRERVAQAQRDAERIRETMAKVDKIARRADANSAKSWSLCARGWRRSRGGSRRWSTRLARARQRTQSLEALRSAQSSLSERLAALEEQLKALAQAPPPKAKVVQAPAKPVKSDPQSSQSRRARRRRPRRWTTACGAVSGRPRCAAAIAAMDEPWELLERWVKLHGKKPSKRSALDDAYVYIGEALKGQKSSSAPSSRFRRSTRWARPRPTCGQRLSFAWASALRCSAIKRAHALL